MNVLTPLSLRRGEYKTSSKTRRGALTGLKCDLWMHKVHGEGYECTMNDLWPMTCDLWPVTHECTIHTFCMNAQGARRKFFWMLLHGRVLDSVLYHAIFSWNRNKDASIIMIRLWLVSNHTVESQEAMKTLLKELWHIRDPLLFLLIPNTQAFM